MNYYINLLSLYLKELHQRRLDKEADDQKYLHFSD